MRARTVLWIVAAVALLVLHAAPASADAALAQVNADNLISRTPYAFQYTVTGTIRDYAAPRLGSDRPLRGEVAFNKYDCVGDNGQAWTAVAAYERPVNAWGWGMQVPEQFWTPEEFDDFLFEGVVPYVYYEVNKVARVGAFGHLNYVFTDVQAAEELSWGLGGFGSYKLSLTDKFTLTPTAVYMHYAAGQDYWCDSDIFSVGASLDYATSANLALWAKLSFTVDATNDLVDDSFWQWSIGANYKVSDMAELMAGFGTTEGYEDFEDAYTIRVGGRIAF